MKSAAYDFICFEQMIVPHLNLSTWIHGLHTQLQAKPISNQTNLDLELGTP
jgi:hypothetical protein